MDFKEEYKNAAEELTPTRAQIDRMKANVIKEIQQPKKNRFLSHAVYIGGTAAACAVITITAVALFPQLKSRDALTNESQSEICLAQSAPNEDTDSAGYVINESDSEPRSGAEEILAEEALLPAADAETAEPEDNGALIKADDEELVAVEVDEADDSAPMTTMDTSSTTAVTESDIEEWDIDEEFDEVIESETNEATENPGMGDFAPSEDNGDKSFDTDTGDFTGEIADETLEYFEEDELEDFSEEEVEEVLEEVAEETEESPEEAEWWLYPSGIVIVKPYTEISLLFDNSGNGAATFIKTASSSASDVVYNTDTLFDSGDKKPYTFEFIASDGSRMLLFDMTGKLLGEYIKK